MRKDIKKLKELFKKNIEPYKKDSFWLMMYSGGKDSTVMMDIALKVIKEEKLDIPVYIMITRVKSEYPMYEKYLNRALMNIRKYIQNEKLKNVKVIENTIPTEKRFLSSLIGKGYPVPRNNMRWCTYQMKIKTAQKIENNLIKKHSGLKPVKIIGTRKEEGSIRAKRIEKNNHQAIDGFYSVMPIQDFTLQDIWNYAKNELSINKKELFELYDNITMDENNSIRQGCWFCPLIKEDKYIKKHYPEIEEFRKILVDHMIKDGIRYTIDRKFNKENVNGFIKTSVRKKMFYKLIDSLKNYKDNTDFFLPFDEFILIQKYMFVDGGDFLFNLTRKYAKIINNPFLESEIEEITKSKSKNVYEIIKNATDSIFDISIEEAAEGVAKKMIFALKGEEEETKIEEKENKYILHITDQSLKIIILKNISEEELNEEQNKIIKKIAKKQSKSDLKNKLRGYTILVLKNYFKYINDSIVDDNSF